MLNHHFVLAQFEHFETIATWFPTDRDLQAWGGPQMHLPLNLEHIDVELDLKAWTNLAMLDAVQHLIGFGQYCLRDECCHLGRLVISPLFRGRGCIQQLVVELATRGCSAFRLDQVALNVLQSNSSAIQAYKKLGFQAYPRSNSEFGPAFYMRAPLSKLLKMSAPEGSDVAL